MNYDDLLPKAVRFLQIRSQASRILDGPDALRFGSDDDEFSEGRVLSLTTRNPFGDINESRSVYANLNTEFQSIAVLRAVYWHGHQVKQIIREGRDYEMSFPARFVVFPVERVKSWLAEFHGLSASLFDGLESEVKITEIRRLRIDVSLWSAERIWEVSMPGHATLNEKWEVVWKHMTEILNTQPILEEFTEGFDPLKDPFQYDLEGYSTDLLASGSRQE